ncbi:MAG TPA: hypothetical protein VNL39_00880 [Xanthobacteraceae bacterium]|nr:hypothetical protein [Xanthobacteraceae bacterium]
MTATRITALVLAFVVWLLPAAPGFAQAAKEPKQKRQAAQQAAVREATRPNMPYWGTDKFRAGPLYHGTDYLGDDPDPFIRLQIQRDLSHRYGGDD